MYLSRVKLDISKRQTMRALHSPAIIHCLVENSFKGERKRNLWRLDSLGNQDYLMIVSEEIPDLSDIIKAVGDEETERSAETKSYTQFLKRIVSGDLWHFRIVANPVKAELCSGKRGRIHAHITEFYQKKWLMDRAHRHGFSLAEDEFCVLSSRWYRFKKKAVDKQYVSLLSVTYEGILKIQDAEKLSLTLCRGIGREKAYGQGMMTIAGKISAT